MRDYEDPDPRQCACPSADARRCVEIRYPRPAGFDEEEPVDCDPCRCDCHEPDEDEPDFWER